MRLPILIPHFSIHRAGPPGYPQHFKIISNKIHSNTQRTEENQSIRVKTERKKITGDSGQNLYPKCPASQHNIWQKAKSEGTNLNSLGRKLYGLGATTKKAISYSQPPSSPLLDKSYGDKSLSLTHSIKERRNGPSSMHNCLVCVGRERD